MLGAEPTQIINEIAGNQMAAQLKYKLMSSGCKPSAYVSKAKVGGDGSQSNGWYSVGGGQEGHQRHHVRQRRIVGVGPEVPVRPRLQLQELVEPRRGCYPAWVMSQALAMAGPSRIT